MVGLHSTSYVNGERIPNARLHMVTCNAPIGTFDVSSVTDMT